VTSERLAGKQQSVLWRGSSMEKMVDDDDEDDGEMGDICQTQRFGSGNCTEAQTLGFGQPIYYYRSSVELGCARSYSSVPE
jgi:hypothetical protein